jgi:hypothetical protein
VPLCMRCSLRGLAGTRCKCVVPAQVWKLLLSLPSCPAVIASLADPSRCMVHPCAGLVGEVYAPTWRGLYVLQCISAYVRFDSSTTASASPAWRALFMSGGSFASVMKLLHAVSPKGGDATPGADTMLSVESHQCRDGIAWAALTVLLHCVGEV